MADKPLLHRRDHEHGGVDPVRIVWEFVGGAAVGTAVLFDTLPQTADYLAFDVDSGIAMANHDDSPVSITQFGNEVIHIENTGSGQIDIESSGIGGIIIECSSSGDLQLRVTGGYLTISGIPSTDPGVSNAIWRDSSGFLRIH